MVLGLDLGTRCGYAVHLDNKGVGTVSCYGEWNFKPNKFDSPSIRFIAFKKEVAAFLQIGVTRVFYEVVRGGHRGIQAAHMYGGFMASLHEVCDEYETPFQGLSVQEIKKYATGKGNASKDAMKAAALDLGYKVKSDNIADAIFIARLGRERM